MFSELETKISTAVQFNYKALSQPFFKSQQKIRTEVFDVVDKPPLKGRGNEIFFVSDSPY
jgi:hypothetical protein